MRIVCISDTHKKFPEVPDGDVLIHSGDFSFRASILDTTEFNEWLGSLPHPNKIFIPGNHDTLFERDEAMARSILTNAITLINQGIDINGIKIWGSPWTPTFGKWHFMGHETKLGQIWGMIPDNTDILVTHGPPHGILDEVIYYDNRTGEHGVRHCGSTTLRDHVIRIKKPKYHIFGHIHPGYGELDMYGVKFINAALLDDRYELVNRPIVFDI